jgi:hypothetical protein
VMGGKAASADVGLENAGKYKSEIDALYACWGYLYVLSVLFNEFLEPDWRLNWK